MNTGDEVLVEISNLLWSCALARPEVPKVDNHADFFLANFVNDFKALLECANRRPRDDLKLKSNIVAEANIREGPNVVGNQSKTFVIRQMGKAVKRHDL